MGYGNGDALRQTGPAMTMTAPTPNIITSLPARVDRLKSHSTAARYRVDDSESS